MKVAHLIPTLHADGPEIGLVDLAGAARQAGIEMLVIGLSVSSDAAEISALRRAGVPVAELDLFPWDPRAVAAHRQAAARAARRDRAHPPAAGRRRGRGGRGAQPDPRSLDPAPHPQRARRPRRPAQAQRQDPGPAAVHDPHDRDLPACSASGTAASPGPRPTCCWCPTASSTPVCPTTRCGPAAAPRWRSSPRDVVALSTAPMRRDQGHELLLDAVEALPDDLPLVVALAGDGPLRPWLESRVAATDALADRVRFTHRHREPTELLAAADLVVHTARAAALPTGLLRAMAMGLPTVATRVGGIPEVVTSDSGLLVALDPAAVAERSPRSPTTPCGATSSARAPARASSPSTTPGPGRGGCTTSTSRRWTAGRAVKPRQTVDSALEAAPDCPFVTPLLRRATADDLRAIADVDGRGFGFQQSDEELEHFRPMFEPERFLLACDPDSGSILGVTGSFRARRHAARRCRAARARRDLGVGRPDRAAPRHPARDVHRAARRVRGGRVGPSPCSRRARARSTAASATASPRSTACSRSPAVARSSGPTRPIPGGVRYVDPETARKLAPSCTGAGARSRRARCRAARPCGTSTCATTSAGERRQRPFFLVHADGFASYRVRWSDSSAPWSTCSPPPTRRTPRCGGCCWGWTSSRR